MTCLSPRTILLQRTTQSNLKFQCKIHEIKERVELLIEMLLIEIVAHRNVVKK